MATVTWAVAPHSTNLSEEAVRLLHRGLAKPSLNGVELHADSIHVLEVIKRFAAVVGAVGELNRIIEAIRTHGSVVLFKEEG